jgi:hypothetical protein
MPVSTAVYTSGRNQESMEPANATTSAGVRKPISLVSNLGGDYR